VQTYATSRETLISSNANQRLGIAPDFTVPADYGHHANYDEHSILDILGFLPKSDSLRQTFGSSTIYGKHEDEFFGTPWDLRYIRVCLYMLTFTINIPPMLVYIPYMDPMGISYCRQNKRT
jgi:hypothetical protein